MNFLALEDVPLAPRNRLRYIPPEPEPRAVSVNTAPDPGPDFPTQHQTPSQRVKCISTESIFTLLQTSYSLLIVAFFKSLIDKLRLSSVPSEKHILNTSLRSGEQPEFDLDIDLPGASTPLDNSRITEVPAEHFSDDSDRNSPLYHNLYDSLFELDSSDDELDSPQYGTSLRVSEQSLYKRRTEIPPAPAKLGDRTADRTAAELLDTEFPSLDEYDRVVRNFYTPFRPVPKPKYSLTDAMLAAIPSYEFSQFIKKRQEQVQELVSQERKAAESQIKPLSGPQNAAVQKIWNSRDLNRQVVSGFSIDITVRDIKTLSEACWLNDNVIDFYLNLVTSRSSNIFCWTTHFFSALKDKGYEGVARWAKRKKVNLLEKDLVIVPINIMRTHWALSVIDNKAKLIAYYDSLSSRGNQRAIDLIKDYMAKEIDRLGLPQIAYKLYPNMKTPQQQNGSDCGVFTCTVAKHLAENLPLSFSQKDMPLIRRRMAFEIMNKSLLDSDPLEPHI